MVVRKKKVKSGVPRKASAKNVTIIPMKAPVVKVVPPDPTKADAAPPPHTKVKLHPIKPPASEAGFTGNEPDWEGTTIVTGEKHFLSKALNWYNAVMDSKHYRKCMEEWLHATQTPKAAEKFIKKLDGVNDKWMSATWAAVLRAHLKGYPLSVYHVNEFWKWFTDVVENRSRAAEAEAKGEPVKERDVISIQDRILNQVRPVLAELDGLSDAILDGEPHDTNAVKTLLHNPEFKAPQYRKIADYMERNLREWNTALLAKKTTDTEEAEDYAEGYRLITLRQLKNVIAAFAEINAEIRGTIEAVKTPRKRRSRSPEKMVSKVKYKLKCEDLDVESIDPKDLLGTTTVYTYNCTRRKITMLVGEFAGSIDVKRSTLIGVNLAASASKTLRNPEAQLKEFMALRKGAGEKWFKAVKCKPRPARARLNVDTVLLRAD